MQVINQMKYDKDDNVYFAGVNFYPEYQSGQYDSHGYSYAREREAYKEMGEVMGLEAIVGKIPVLHKESPKQLELPFKYHQRDEHEDAWNYR